MCKNGLNTMSHSISTWAIKQYSIVLYWPVLYCQYCIVLHYISCIALYCIVCIACIVLYCLVLYCIVLCCICMAVTIQVVQHETPFQRSAMHFPQPPVWICQKQLIHNIGPRTCLQQVQTDRTPGTVQWLLESGVEQSKTG